MKIIRLRVEADTENDIRAFAELIETIPAVKAGKPSIRENYRDEGFRGYLTLIVEDEETLVISETERTGNECHRA